MSPDIDFAQFVHALRPFMAEALAPCPKTPRRSPTSPGATLSPPPFAHLAARLFRLQFTHNPVYRAFAEAAGRTPETVSSVDDIPAMPAAAFKEFEVSSIPVPDRTTVFHSSGTTVQQPSRHFHHAASLELYAESLLPWFVRHLVPEGTLENLEWISLTPTQAEAPHSSLVYMLETVRLRLRARHFTFAGGVKDGVWTLNPLLLQAAVERCVTSHRSAVVVGTAFNFVHWLDHLIETKQRLQLPLGTRIMETGGYKGRSRVLSRSLLHRELEHWLGVPREQIRCEYGMSELSSQAYDEAAGTAWQSEERIFHFPPWAQATVLSPETGRRVEEGTVGRLRILDLANVWSVMALQTEDLAIQRGDGFELIGRPERAEPRGCSLLAP